MPQSIPVLTSIGTAVGATGTAATIVGGTIVAGARLV